MDASKSTI